MSEAVITPAPASGPDPSRIAGLMPLVRSLAINLLGPYLLFRAVQGSFPANSPTPLLISALIPAGEFALMYLRRRTVDVVAIISLVQLGVGVVIALAAGSALAGITGQALQHAALGLAFAVSLLVGRPLVVPLARLTMAGDDPDLQAEFDADAATSAGRAIFARITLIWAAGLCLESAVFVAATRMLTTAGYILFSNIAGACVYALLIWASIQYGRWAGRRAA